MHERLNDTEDKNSENELILCSKAMHLKANDNNFWKMRSLVKGEVLGGPCDSAP